MQVTEKAEVEFTVSLFCRRKSQCFIFFFQAFDCSIRRDEHLAVAFFQRGITFYRKQRQETPLISTFKFHIWKRLIIFFLIDTMWLCIIKCYFTITFLLFCDSSHANVMNFLLVSSCSKVRGEFGWFPAGFQSTKRKPADRLQSTWSQIQIICLWRKYSKAANRLTCSCEVSLLCNLQMIAARDNSSSILSCQTVQRSSRVH